MQSGKRGSVCQKESEQRLKNESLKLNTAMKKCFYSFIGKFSYKENIIQGCLQRLSPLQYFIIPERESIDATKAETILMTTLKFV